MVWLASALCLTGLMACGLPVLGALSRLNRMRGELERADEKVEMLGEAAQFDPHYVRRTIEDSYNQNHAQFWFGAFGLSLIALGLIVALPVVAKT